MADDIQTNTSGSVITAGTLIDNTESRIFSVSVRGWIALIVILTLCIASGFSVTINPQLATIASMVIAFYFGQNKKTE